MSSRPNDRRAGGRSAQGPAAFDPRAQRRRFDAAAFDGQQVLARELRLPVLASSGQTHFQRPQLRLDPGQASSEPGVAGGMPGTNQSGGAERWPRHSPSGLEAGDRIAKRAGFALHRLGAVSGKAPRRWWRTCMTVSCRRRFLGPQGDHGPDR